MGGGNKTAGSALGVLVAALTPVLVLLAFVFLVVSILSPASSASCAPGGVPAFKGGGEWLATSYGPPWEGIEGSGVTATGINLREDPKRYIIAVDPSVIPLGSPVHVSPNPFGDDAITFEAADTGGAINGKHIDIYDWRGRAYQDAWGERQVTVTPAAKTGAASLLEATPGTPLEGTEESGAGEPDECEASGAEGPLPLTPGQRAKVLADGLAAAPKEAPAAVKAMIAAGNRLDHAAYVYGGGHGPSLNTLQPAYDCSSSVSYVLHGGGVFGDEAEDSTELESYGEPGPGKWVTVYANGEHAFMFVAGVRFDTSYNGTDTGPSENQSGPRWRVFPEVPKWAQWVVRHPPGL
jgi:3D (Asp-Asp-Asp) domain-containing protein